MIEISIGIDDGAGQLPIGSIVIGRILTKAFKGLPAMISRI